MAMIGQAATRAAPWTTLSPTPPQPKTAIDWPIFSCARLLISPRAVVTAQPIRAAISKGTSWGIGVTRFSETTEYSLNVVTQPELTVRPFQTYLAGLAVDAGPFPPVEHDMVAGLDDGNAGAGFHHHAAAFVAQQVGQETVRPLGAGDLVELRTADAAALDAHEHLPHVQRLRLDLVEHQRGVEVFQDGCFEFHVGRITEDL